MGGLFPPMSPTEAPTHLLWRLINPSLQSYHHTTILDAEITACLICQIIIYSQFGLKRPSSIVGMAPFVMIVALRGVQPAWIARRRVAFHRLFSLLSSFILFSITVLSLSILFGFTTGAVKDYRTDTMTWKQFLEKDFGSRISTDLDGQRLLLMSLQSIYTAKCTADVLMWPHSLFGTISAGLFPFVTVFLIIFPFFDTYERVFMSCTLSLSQVVVVGVVIYTEYLKRTEYHHLREAILARDLCERCLSRCWHDCSQPLVSLITWQARLRKNVLSVWAKNDTRGQKTMANTQTLRAGSIERHTSKHVRGSGGTTSSASRVQLLGGSFHNRHHRSRHLSYRHSHSSQPMHRSSNFPLLTPNLLVDIIPSLEQLKRSICMSTELLHEMQMSLVSSRPRDMSVLIASMEVYLLRPIVHKICSMFVLETDELTIKFNVCIHPSLLLVRCDKALLEAMLCSTCRNAVERIQQSIKASKQQEQQQAYLQSTGELSRRISVGGRDHYKHKEGVCHTVLISLKPGRFQEKLRFSDVRMMLLQVFDTSLYPQLDPSSLPSPSALTSSSHALAQPFLRHTFLKNIYRSYMEHHHQPDVLYDLHTLLPTQADGYSTCEHLCIPYKMCPATPKVAAFFPTRSALTEVIERTHWTYLSQYHGDISTETVSKGKKTAKENLGEDNEETGEEEEEEEGWGKEGTRAVHSLDTRVLSRTSFSLRQSSWSSSDTDASSSLSSSSTCSLASPAEGERPGRSEARGDSRPHTPPSSSLPLLSSLPLPQPLPVYAPAALAILCPHWQHRYGGPPSLLSLRDYAHCGWTRKLHYLHAGDLPRREVVCGEQPAAVVVIEQDVIRAAAREAWQQQQYLQDLLLYLRGLGSVALIVRVGAVDDGDDERDGDRRRRPPPTDDVQEAQSRRKARRSTSVDNKRVCSPRWELDDLPWTRSLSEGLSPDFDVAGPLDRSALLRLRHQWHLRLLHLSIPSAT